MTGSQDGLDRVRDIHRRVDELDRGVVVIGDNDARRAGRGRLDDDEPVTLAARRENQAEGGGERFLHLPGRNETGHLDRIDKILDSDASLRDPG